MTWGMRHVTYYIYITYMRILHVTLLIRVYRIRDRYCKG